MNIHEYQAKRLLERFGVPVPRGRVAYTAEEAQAIARTLDGSSWLIKAQSPGSGETAFAATPEAVAVAARRMLGEGVAGHATRVLVEEALPEGRALVVLLTVDAEVGRVTCAVGERDGHNRPGEDRPDRARLAIDPVVGLRPHTARRLASRLGLGAVEAAAFASCLSALYRAFLAFDASRIEVDPLLTHVERGVVAVGLAMTVDDSALFRQQEIAALRDEAAEDAAELEGARHDLNYMRLPGSIGCLVNGAGLAMATLDTIRLHGGAAANFLDMGGGATRERVSTAFKLILSDPHVEGVLVNVFGGIMRCDVIAEGIVAAAREVGLHVPLVVRLEGTNVELGKRTLRESGLPIVLADSIDEAAIRVVAAVREAA
jgi:succinyl-CoA synthetase beta subunit